jgi:hypothetical protein
MSAGPTVKVQTWGDDLRLPCFINAAETTGLLTELEPLRRPSLPFQSKHLPALKRNTWFVLRRPHTKEYTGLVVIWPAMKCCVYISGEPLSQKRPYTRVALLRIRVDPQFLSEGAGLTVFSATLSSVTRRITIDDTLIWKGRHVIDDEIFSKRWGLAVQWIEHYCLLDPRLLGGIEIEMAKWSPLEKLKPEKSWELQPDEAGRKRYLWIAKYAETPSPPTDTSDAPAAFAPTLDTGPLVAVATRDVGPEQWILSAGDGTSLGRALIRTLAISAPLRSLKSSTTRVEVEWNPVFTKWEVKALSESLATVSGAKFAAAK